MKILMIGPNKNSPTDGVIIKGAYNLLDFLNPTIDYVLLRDTVPQQDFNEDKSYDLLIIAGTPWIWDQFYKSKKWSNMMRFRQIHHNAKVIYLGIGACVCLGKENKVCKDKESVHYLKKTYDNTLVIARDALAKNYLDNAEVKSYHLPCPAHYAYSLDTIESSKQYNVLVFCEPSLSISSVCHRDLNEIYSRYKNFYVENNPQVYCVSEKEKKFANDIGLNPEKLVDQDHTLNVMRDADKVLSGRVHCAIPAKVVGASVDLIAIDSRYMTIEFDNPFDHVKSYIDLLNLFIL